MSKLAYVTSAVALLLFVACGGGSSQDDAGTPGQQDSGAQQDGGQKDMGTGQLDGPQTDTGTGQDDGGGVQQDGGGHTGTGHDPRIVSDPDPNQVACGTATCIPANGEVCCVTMAGMSCKASSACGGALSSPAACDGPEDCPTGQHCCVAFPGGAHCNAAACSGNAQELCYYDTDCATGHCTACGAPGSSLIYGLCTAAGTCPSPYNNP
jgi:hypothetical protein